MLKTAYLSLGSNKKRRINNLNNAQKLLKECGLKISKKSSIHETKAVSKIKQRDFLNMCIEIQTNFPPEKLLQICLMVEKEIGRDRSIKKRTGYERPRLIDIDILLYENLIINKRNLIIPHKRMHERRFVLEPLNEIAPHFKHPVQQKTIRMLLNEVKDKSIFKS